MSKPESPFRALRGAEAQPAHKVLGGAGLCSWCFVTYSIQSSKQSFEEGVIGLNLQIGQPGFERLIPAQ